MTTIFPGLPFRTGNWVVGDGRRPVVPLEGKGGWAPLLDGGGFGVGLSAMVLCSWVNPEN